MRRCCGVRANAKSRSAAGTCSLPRGFTSRTVRRSSPSPHHVGAGHGWKGEEADACPDLGNDSRHVLGVVGWNGRVEKHEGYLFLYLGIGGTSARTALAIARLPWRRPYRLPRPRAPVIFHRAPRRARVQDVHDGRYPLRLTRREPADCSCDRDFDAGLASSTLLKRNSRP